jgi:hydroxymethylpyrimidine pyrophosphatase-like HAD family hydrolase
MDNVAATLALGVQLLSAAPCRLLQQITVLATDIDGTMTLHGRLHADVLDMVQALTTAGIEVLPVTGRPAGEVLGLVRYLPGIRRAIAENGGVLVQADLPLHYLRPPIDPKQLAASARELAGPLPWTLAPCSFCRVSDQAWIREPHHTDAALAQTAKLAADMGLFLTWSSVHLHLTNEPADKGLGLLQVLATQGLAGTVVATIGDAVNDVGLWHPQRFALRVATADVLPRWSQLDHKPAYLVAAEATGWLELASALVNSRRAS